MQENIDELKNLVGQIEVSLGEYDLASNGYKSYKEIRNTLQEVKKSAQRFREAILENYKKKVAANKKTE